MDLFLKAVFQALYKAVFEADFSATGQLTASAAAQPLLAQLQASVDELVAQATSANEEVVWTALGNALAGGKLAILAYPEEARFVVTDDQPNHRQAYEGLGAAQDVAEHYKHQRAVGPMRFEHPEKMVLWRVETPLFQHPLRIGVL